MNGTTILLSVRPRFADDILDGKKSVELRRVRPRLSVGDTIIMYVTAPRKEIRALLVVEEVIEAPPRVLWTEVREAVAVTNDEFETYFDGAEVAVGIRIQVEARLVQPITLHELRQVAPNFSPPQSYRYLDSLGSELRMLLSSAWSHGRNIQASNGSTGNQLQDR